MTQKQRLAILDVCRALLSSGLAFAYQKERKEPEYSATRGLAEIVKIVEGEDVAE
jgi:hypothetical protein